jgi:multidrug efflux pump subunit AcrB
LEAAAGEITAALAEYPVLINIQDNLEKGTPELRIRLLPERAAALGLDALSVGTFIRDIFDGRTVTTFFRDNQEIDVIVKYAGKGSFNVFELDGLMIPAADGRQIPFSSVARIEQGEALAGIKRVDGKREVTITSEAYSDETVPDINRDIEVLFESQIQPRYPDLELNVGGEFAELNNLLIQILRVFLIGIFLIYLILGVQFKSYLKPLLILLTVPFAFFGVILYLFISGTPFSTTVLYAGVALAGIAVNDSIVLISFINERRDEGLSVKEAVIEATGTRLRPIILTSLTTVAGLLPTAIGIGGRSVVWSPMASTIVFGLIFSTITALLVIPAFYGLFFDRKKKAAAEA